MVAWVTKSSTQNFLADLSNSPFLVALKTNMSFAFNELPFSAFPVWALSLILIAGLCGLAYGGDWLTRGAAATSVNLKISPVVVGLTVVSLATSMPELMTSLLAVGESPGLAIGNILGSNVANIGLILGISALIAPFSVQSRLIRREVPILVGVTVLFTGFAVGGFQRGDGFVLLTLTLAYLVYVVRGERREPSEADTAFIERVNAAPRLPMGKAAGLVLLGTVLLAAGADLLVGSSAEIAGRFGLSEALIGLTIVAVGTSLPELAASVAAARVGHSDLCAGNIVGSNLFNLLLVGGGAVTMSPFPVDPMLLRVEFPAMLFLTVLLLWFFKSDHTVSRREGAILLSLYLSVLSFSAFVQMGNLF